MFALVVKNEINFNRVKLTLVFRNLALPFEVN